MKFFFIAIPFLVSPLWSQVEVAELPEDLVFVNPRETNETEGRGAWVEPSDSFRVGLFQSH
ncbi:hypothetical protein N9B87_01375, partial [bacterium]|nr:hypothetical protein [bacterium]